MEIRRGRVYIVDFNPRVKTKPGKLRPAIALQSDLVNQAGYRSTIVIPATAVMASGRSPSTTKTMTNGWPAGTGGYRSGRSVLGC